MDVGRFDRLDLAQLPLSETPTLLSAASGRSGGTGRRSAAVEADSRQRAVLAEHRRAGESPTAASCGASGCWRWIGDPVMPPGLVELIESRIGDLPSPVGDVIDVVAVGEPIELAALSRITDAGASRTPRRGASSPWSPRAAASRSGSRIRSTGRCAAGAPHGAGYDDCAGWSQDELAASDVPTTFESSFAAQR